MEEKEEIRNGYKVSSEMKAVWTIQLKMVQKLLEVCERNDLRIWADGGTLLGLVREHGYIPWDDDIDMLMPRKDYDKLISIAPSEFHSPFFFQCSATEKNYFKGHSQLRYDGTSAILASDLFLPIHQGIFIDIFVYDSIPDNKDEDWEKRLHRADKIFHRLNQYTYGYVFCVNPIAIFDQLYGLAYCKWKGAQNLFREYEDLFRFYEDKQTSLTACPCFNRRIFKTSTKQKEWYRETVYLSFEDIILPAPIDYDKVLRTQYGNDYMTPCKAESMHGGFLVLDPFQSYTKYIPKMRRHYKRRGWFLLLDRLKKLIVSVK